MVATGSSIAVLVILVWPSFVVCTNSLARETLWVAPNSSFCENRTGPCKTLTQYREANMLNRSNVNWKFISGPTPHLLTGGLYVFDRVTNVSLVCEEGVTSGSCLLECTALVSPTTSDYQMCTFVFNQAYEVSITGLTVSYQVSSIPRTICPADGIQKYLNETTVYGKCRTSDLNLNVTACEKQKANLFRTWAFVDSTNIHVADVTFVGAQNSWFILRPKGIFSVKSCYFSKLSSGIPQYDPLGTSINQSHVVIMLKMPREPIVNFHGLNITFEHTLFKGQYYLPHYRNCSIGNSYSAILLSSDETLNGHPVNFTISECKFLACPVLNMYVLEDRRFQLAIKRTLIDGRVSNETARDWLVKCRVYYKAPAIESHLYNFHQPCPHSSCVPTPEYPQGLFLVSHTNFTRLASGRTSAISVHFMTLKNINHSMQVVLERNKFTNNYGIYHRNLLFFRHDVFLHGSWTHNMAKLTKFTNNTTPLNYPLRMESNFFISNFIESRIDYFCVIFTRIHQKFIIVNADVHDKGQPYKYKYICYRLGTVYLSGFEGMYRVQYVNNVIKNNSVSALTLFKSQVEMHGRNLVWYNLGYYGGGIRISGNSVLLFRNDSYLSVVRNRAYFSGGGFYIMDLCTLDINITRCPCFFQFIHDNGSYVQHLPQSSLKPQVFLEDNKAFSKGKGSASAIFNSNINSCILKTNVAGVANNAQVFREVFNISAEMLSTFVMSSIPRKICFNCSENRESCQAGNAKEPLKYYHGQNLHISVLLEGDMNIPMSGVLYVDLVNSRYADNESDVFPPELHSTHVLLDQCNKLTIPPLPNIPSFYHDSDSFNLQLRVELFAGTSVLNDGRFLYTTIQTHLIDGCPSGFVEVGSDTRYKICNCAESLESANVNIQCDLDKELFTKPSKSNKLYWIGKKGKDILWSTRCLYSLCNSSVSEVSIENMDAQCLHGRTGVLCGQCPEGYSVQIGTAQCTKCNNWYLLSLVVVVLGGPILLVVIGFLNLTITVGAVNGFVYYATVIVITKDIFLDLNLCLYHGMRDFEKTLLSFLFPVYLLVLVGIACCLPRCKCINMHRINRRIGPRITPVLATLITAAYLFMSEATIKILLVAWVNSTDGNQRLVWMLDGSQGYFESRDHIILGTIALTSLVFFLFPAAMVATFGDLLRRCIKGRYYMNFLDTFHGAFRFRFGFWFGVRLLILTVLMGLRLVLDPDEMHLLVVCTSTLVVIFQICAQPYRGVRIERCTSRAVRNRYCHGNMNRSLPNFLDNLYQFNLIAMFATELYLKGSNNFYYKARDVFFVSYVLALLELLFIIVYHLLEFTPFGEWVIERWHRIRSRINRWKDDRRGRPGEVPIEPEEPDDGVRDLELRLNDCWDSDESTDDSGTEEDRRGNVAPILRCNKPNVALLNRAVSTHDVAPLLVD